MCLESIQGNLLLHADDAVIVTAHSGIRLISRAALKDHRVGCGDMGVTSNHETCPPIAVVAHSHFLTGRFTMHVHNDGIRHSAKRHGIQCRIHGRKGTRQRLAHEHIPLHLDDPDTTPIRQAEQIGSLARCAGSRWVIYGAQQTGFAFDIGQSLALIPGMITESQAISTCGKEFLRNDACQAEAPRRILSVY